MANEKLIPLSEVKKKITAVRQYFSGYPSTDQDKLARSVAKLCLEEVGKIKPVDAAPVVRCKDCKYWHEETGWCDHHSWFIEEDGEPCHPWESNNWKMLTEDDFCSYGERRTNGK